ncbi:MAG: membrane dipeptidase, partial [Alphaproteobacteria bacterium]
MPKRPTWLIAALAAITLVVVVGLIMWLMAPAHGPHKVKVTPQQAMDVHQKLLTIDTHVDIPPEWASDKFDSLHNPRYDFDLERMRQGGLKAAFFIVYVPQGPRTIAGNAQAVSEAFAKFAAIHRMTDERNANLIELAHTAEDVERISAANKLVALIGIENGYALGHHIELLKMYYDLGARYLGLAYNGVNDLADGGMAEGFGATGAQVPEFHGLSEFGKQVIAECNRLGIMVDVAHSSHDVQMQAAA